MSHSVNVTVSECVVCSYLASLKQQYSQIGMNDVVYLAKVESMLSLAVMYNLQADSTSLYAMWAAQSADLASLKTTAFTSWCSSYFSLYTPPVIEEPEPEP